ncbi:MAG TPA: DUF5666 domain-containing protein [Candidatus Dormibacteraeota bacterium]|nr:DUF5666 domain-containing protein [Candidatus Dormibacteraeota bacterium]
MNVKVVIAGLAVLVGLLAGFYGGYNFGQAHAASSTRGATAGLTQGQGTQGFAGAAFAGCPSPGASPRPNAGANGRSGATGTISLLTSDSFTVQNPRCNTSVKVTFAPSVIIRKTVDGQVSDLQNNQTVTVQGQRQPDGSIRATTITIVPAGAGGFGGLAGGRGAGFGGQGGSGQG